MPIRLGVGNRFRFSFRSAKGGGRSSYVRAEPIERLESRVLLSHTWFVATTGNDAAAGTLAQPFRTIQRAAGIASSGDTVLIRAGTYRETVRPAQGGITFESYNNEPVIVSGADAVSGWTDNSGAVYKTAIPWDLGEGNNQVFVDGQMVNEARWPNSGPDPLHPTLETAQNIVASGGRGTLYDSHLTGNWTGAVIHVTSGSGWYAQTGMVTGSGPGWLSFTYTPDSSWTVPQAGNRYYLYGKFQALDSAGEWFRDGSGQLYLWDPAGDSPARHVVEVKRRQFAFDLSGRSNVIIEGIRIFAATIKTDAGSSNLLIDHVHASYLSQFSWQNTGWVQPNDSGITLNGANSTIQNSMIVDSAGDGVFVSGAGAVVQNDVICDVAYNAGDSAGIRVYGSGARISNNLVFNTGRNGIVLGAPAARVLGNTIHDAMLLTSDGGAIYTVHQNGGGAQIAYNTIYNVRNLQPSAHPTWFTGVGIFLDDNSSNFNVSNNSVRDTDVAIKMNYTARGMRVTGNALAGSLDSISGNGQGDWGGSVISGNVLYGAIYAQGPGAVMSGNSYSGGAPAIHPISDPPASSSWVPPTPTSASSGAADAGTSVGSGSSSGAAIGATSGSGSGNKTSTGPVAAPVPAPRSALTTIDAASYDQASATPTAADAGVTVAGGTWLRFSTIDFATGVRSISVDLGALGRTGIRVELRLDSPTGTRIGSLGIHAGRRGRPMRVQSARVRHITGVHDLYLVLIGRTGQVTVQSFVFMQPPQKRR